MATPERINITDDTRLIDLTVGDLKALIGAIVDDAVNRVVWEIQQELPDPDEGLELRPEVAELLRQYLRERPKGEPAEDVMKALGLPDK